jgi:hypothetical protein
LVRIPNPGSGIGPDRHQFVHNVGRSLRTLGKEGVAKWDDAGMGEDIHVYEAVEIVPPVGEAEIEAALRTGEYTKVTWDDPRMGDGYFVRVEPSGLLGVGVIPIVRDDGSVVDCGVVVQVDPMAEEHHDEPIERELRKIIADFGITPSNVKRMFDRALYVEKPDGDEMIVVRDGVPVRMKAE